MGVSRIRQLLAFFTLAVFAAAFIYCVGDDVGASSGSLPDGGTDANGGGNDANDNNDTGSGNNDAATDAGTDADADAAPRCSGDAGWGTPEIVGELNSNDNSRDFCARLSSDELTAYFTSNRYRDAGDTGGYPGFDIFKAGRMLPTGTFGTPARIPPSFFTPNLTANPPDLCPTVTADGTKMYIDTYQPGRSIYLATKTGNDFTNPTAVSAINNGGGENGTPYVLPDNTRIYFTSSRVGSKFDLYYSDIQSGLVAAAVPVNGVNDATYADMFPVATANDLTLYFGSSRDNAGYNFDIFVATRASTGDDFGNVTKLPASINAYGDGGVTANYPSYVTADECILYFTRTTSGKDTIWRVKKN